MASIVQLAGMLPRDPQFREWVSQYTVPPQEVSIDQAAEFIRVVCGIDSRRQLELDAGAANRFHEYLRRPFVAWRSQQHQPQGAEA